MNTRYASKFICIAVSVVATASTSAEAAGPATFDSNAPNTPAVTATANQPGAASNGVRGLTSSPDASAVYGEHLQNGVGVFGRGGPNGGVGAHGVVGVSDNGAGVSGTAANIGVFAHNNTSGFDAYLGARCCAGDFHGPVSVLGKTTTQVLEITGGNDLAEPFAVDEQTPIQSGMVVAIDPAHPGQLRLADHAYDRTVAGIISGANGVNPGLTMTSDTSPHRSKLVALTGRVYVFADATHDPIQPGDLLTTADTPGHAMKVTDYGRAQGAIIGKAMSPLANGSGLVLVLVSLQ